MSKITKNSTVKNVSSLPKLELERTGYILLPAWFITITSNNTPYTFLVNGQSGRCTGTAPWSKVKVFGTIAAATAALWALLFTLLTKVEVPHINKITDIEKADYIIIRGGPQIAAGLIALAAGITLPIAIKKFLRLYRKLKRTGSVTTLIFAKKRQGGVK